MLVYIAPGEFYYAYFTFTWRIKMRLGGALV